MIGTIFRFQELPLSTAENSAFSWPRTTFNRERGTLMETALQNPRHLKMRVLYLG